MQYKNFRVAAPVREAARKSPMTQMTLAAAADLTQGQLSNLLNGQHFTSVLVPRIQRVAEMVGIDPRVAVVPERRPR